LIVGALWEVVNNAPANKTPRQDGQLKIWIVVIANPRRGSLLGGRRGCRPACRVSLRHPVASGGGLDRSCLQKSIGSKIREEPKLILAFCCSRRRGSRPRRPPGHPDLRRVPEAVRPLRHRALHPAQSRLVQQRELRTMLRRRRQGAGQRGRGAAPLHHKHAAAEHLRPHLRQEGVGESGAYAAARLAQATRTWGSLRRRRRLVHPQAEGLGLAAHLLQSGGRRGYQARHQAGTHGHHRGEQPVQEVEDGVRRRRVQHDTQW
jgi:hypothetical protein